jgi:hypothetical protein
MSRKGGFMDWSFCVLRKEKQQIILQGVTHLAPKDAYQSVRNLIRSCSARGYAIFREFVQIDKPGDTDHGEVLTIMKWMSLFLDKYVEVAGCREEAAEAQEVPIESNHFRVDVNSREYAQVLAEEGFCPEYELIKCSFDHEYLGKPLPEWYTERMKEFKSIKDFSDYVVGTMNLRKFPRSMNWREAQIVDMVLGRMNEGNYSKGLMVYGDYHISGFASILQSRNWILTYSRNLKPRE